VRRPTRPITRRSQVQILPPLERRWKRRLSRLKMGPGRQDFCPTLARSAEPVASVIRQYHELHRARSFAAPRGHASAWFRDRLRAKVPVGPPSGAVFPRSKFALKGVKIRFASRENRICRRNASFDTPQVIESRLEARPSEAGGVALINAMNQCPFGVREGRS
jgi:hypothetical protein